MYGVQSFKDQPSEVRVPVVRHCSPSPPHQQQRLPPSRRWRSTNNIRAKCGCLLRRINKHCNPYQSSRQYVLAPATSRTGHPTIDSNVNSSLASKHFVISRIDYWNSLFAELPAYQLDRVQSILKFAARLIYGRAKYDHVTPMLWDKLHWLRVPQMIQYKCCLLVYKSLHGLTRSCISNLCTRVQLSDRRSSLRSATRRHNKLVVPRSSKFGKRSFTISSPWVWNSLPDHVVAVQSLDTFKYRLKTHLLGLSYPLSTWVFC